mgnify:CR=1 FL=1
MKLFSNRFHLKNGRILRGVVTKRRRQLEPYPTRGNPAKIPPNKNEKSWQRPSSLLEIKSALRKGLNIAEVLICNKSDYMHDFAVRMRSPSWFGCILISEIVVVGSNLRDPFFFNSHNWYGRMLPYSLCGGRSKDLGNVVGRLGEIDTKDSRFF